MERADRERVAQAEGEHLPDQTFTVGVVDLVDHEEHRTLGQLPHDDGDTAVLLGDPGDGIDHHKHHIRFADRLLALAAHLVVQRRALRDPAARVDEGERHALPVGVDELAVAGDARLLLHDRDALAHDPVHQRGLPHVGPTDDRDGGPVMSHAASQAPSVARAWPSVGIISTGRGRSSGPVPSRNRPFDRHTSGSR